MTIDKRSKSAKGILFQATPYLGKLNPVTRSVPGGKVYNRKKDKRRIDVESRDGFDAGFLLNNV